MSRAFVRSFDPIAGKNAQILVLGSMPGRASLAAGQYYAHSQNAFWRITAELLQFDAGAPYQARVQALKSARIAVWDVLQSCVRQGSLDTMIENDTEIANDFHRFFRVHGRITHVFFNGAKAEASFKRHAAKEFGTVSIKYARLPSTSPANAAAPFARKLEAWRAILRR